jgi:hypothetical protein
MDIRAQVAALVAGIHAGRSLEVFEEFYADDVVINWNGVDDRVGKAANREFREFFAHNVQFHFLAAESVLVDGDKAVIEWVYEVSSAGGPRIRRKHVVVQTWESGKIVRQSFYVPGPLWLARGSR